VLNYEGEKENEKFNFGFGFGFVVVIVGRVYRGDAVHEPGRCPRSGHHQRDNEGCRPRWRDQDNRKSLREIGGTIKF